MADIEGKKKFILAITDEDLRKRIVEMIHKYVSGASIVQAADGTDAHIKIRNDLPHVLILEKDLPKSSGIQVMESVFIDRNMEGMAVILISAVPEKELFVEQIATGRAQFLTEPREEEKFEAVVVRALNYCGHKLATEFSIKFLAAGDMLLREGEKGQHVYILRKGGLKAHVQREGEQLFLGKIEPGEFVGEMAYINGEPRSADVTADTSSELIEIPMTQLDHLLFLKPAWARALMMTLSRRVKNGNIRSSKE